MFLDIIVLILVVFAIIQGRKNGLILAVFSLLAFVIGLATALKFSSIAATYIRENTNISEKWLPFLAFAVVFLVVILLVRLGAKAIEGIIKVAQLGWMNKLGGVLLYTIIYLFIFSILLSYAGRLNLIKEETLAESRTYPYIRPIAPAMLNTVGEVLPFFKNMF